MCSGIQIWAEKKESMSVFRQRVKKKKEGGVSDVKTEERSENRERSRQVQLEKHTLTQLTEFSIVTAGWNAGCS